MNYLELDKQHIWHPFSQYKNSKTPLLAVKGEGVYIVDSEGKKYIDGISSWWVNLHGHANLYIAQKVYEQLTTLEHVIFDGFTHPKAIELSQHLLAHLPNNLQRVFYSDNGSTANEVAIKMALQYWHNKGIAKNKIVALHNAYHGDTFGSMSVSARNVFTHAFETLLFEVIRINAPQNNEQYWQEIEFLFDQYHHEIAALIVEPLVQGACGMLMYSPEALNRLWALAHQYEIIIIADEVMTGFGRTGTYFASNQVQHQPDIVCLSKGITGGTMALGATVCTEQIFEAYISTDKRKTFFHGHSYTANPIACAAACASFDLLATKATWKQIHLITQAHLYFATTLHNNPKVKEARTCGTILAIELQSNEETSYLNSIGASVGPFFLERGILLRPLGNVIYVLPPYCITQEQLQTVYTAINEFIHQLYSN
jgi:adenosylmethionine---8-amino-7-oxononanoate aminotransferase